MDRGLLIGGHGKCASHHGGLGRSLEGRRKQLLIFSVHLVHTAREDLAHALFQTDRSEVRERLSGDSKDFHRVTMPIASAGPGPSLNTSRC